MQKIKLLQNILIFVLLFHCNYIKALMLPDTQIVVQQIRYFSEEAKEVYIVWGIKNWDLPEETLRPEGSFIKENLLYSPMKQGKGFFSVNLTVHPDSRIDYKFWIAKGPFNKEINEWDNNNAYQKDYHTVALSDNVVLINSKIIVRPKETLTILDFSIPFLSVTCTLLLLLLLIKEYWHEEIQSEPGMPKIIIAGGIILVLILALIRTSVMGFSWDLYFHPLRYFPKLIWAGFYDLIYVGIICTLFFILDKIFGSYPLAKRILISLFIFTGISSILVALLNIKVVEMFGESFSYQPWYLLEAGKYSEITITKIIQILSVCCSSIFAGIFLSYTSEIIMSSVTIKHGVISSLVCASFVYLTIAPKAIVHYSWNYSKLANPVVSFFEGRKFDPDKRTLTIETSDIRKTFIAKNTISSDHHLTAPE